MCSHNLVNSRKVTRELNQLKHEFTFRTSEITCHCYLGDIVIDIRKNANAEYSDTIAEMVNVAGTVTAFSIQRHCGSQTMTNNVEADTLEIDWRRFVFLPFLDHLLQEFGTRFNAITRKA